MNLKLVQSKLFNVTNFRFGILGSRRAAALCAGLSVFCRDKCRGLCKLVDMIRETKFDGVLAPVLTPFGKDGQPNADALIRLCRDLLADGASGLALFGTTSEANSLSLDERLQLLGAVLEAGIPPARLMPGTGACALPDAVRLTRAAVDGGAGGVLVLPPFYYKNAPEDGLYTYYAGLIDGVGRSDLRLYLYHIPQMSGAPIAPSLIRRLIDSFGPVIAGLKDSAGKWEDTRALIEAFPEMAIFPGSERFLLDGLKVGGAGCISATANINMAAISATFRAYPSGEAEGLSTQIIALRDIYEKYPMIPALKAVMADRTRDDGWRAVRPPLVALSDENQTSLKSALKTFNQE